MATRSLLVLVLLNFYGGAVAMPTIITTTTNQAAMCGDVTPSSCESTWRHNFFGIELSTYQQSKPLFKIGSTIVAGGVTYYVDAIQHHSNCNSNVGLVYVANTKECADGTPWEHTAQCGFGGQLVAPLTTVDKWCLYSSATTSLSAITSTNTSSSATTNTSAPTSTNTTLVNELATTTTASKIVALATTATTTSKVLDTTSATVSVGYPASPIVGHIASPNLAAVIEGYLVFNVSNEVQFAREPNVTTVMKMVVAQLLNVVDAWITSAEVSLVSGRRLEKFSNYYQMQVGAVKVEFCVVVPPVGESLVTVTTIMETFDSMPLGEVTLEVNKVLNSGVLSQPYNATVLQKTVYRPTALLTPAPSKESEHAVDAGLIFLFACCAVLLLILSVILLRMRWLLRETVKEEEEYAPVSTNSQALCLDIYLEGSQTPCNVEKLLQPPYRITCSDVEKIREFARDVLDFREHNFQVYLTYASGQRPQDAASGGPGTFYAAGVVKMLYDNGIRCCCELMFPPDVSREAMAAQILTVDSCKLLIVIQTRALYGCMHCLHEIYAAQRKNLAIFPLRFEKDLPRKEEEWPQIESSDLDNVLKLAQVQDKFGRLNSVPSPPYTVVEHPTVLGDVMTDISIRLRETIPGGNRSSLNQPCPSVVGMIGEGGVEAAKVNHTDKNGDRYEFVIENGRLIENYSGNNASGGHENSGVVSLLKYKAGNPADVRDQHGRGPNDFPLDKLAKLRELADIVGVPNNLEEAPLIVGSSSSISFEGKFASTMHSGSLNLSVEPSCIPRALRDANAHLAPGSATKSLNHKHFVTAEHRDEDCTSSRCAVSAVSVGRRFCKTDSNLNDLATSASELDISHCSAQIKRAVTDGSRSKKRDASKAGRKNRSINYVGQSKESCRSRSKESSLKKDRTEKTGGASQPLHHAHFRRKKDAIIKAKEDEKGSNCGIMISEFDVSTTGVQDITGDSSKKNHIDGLAVSQSLPHARRRKKEGSSSQKTKNDRKRDSGTQTQERAISQGGSIKLCQGRTVSQSRSIRRKKEAGAAAARKAADKPGPTIRIGAVDAATNKEGTKGPSTDRASKESNSKTEDMVTSGAVSLSVCRATASKKLPALQQTKTKERGIACRKLKS